MIWIQIVFVLKHLLKYKIIEIDDEEHTELNWNFSVIYYLYIAIP